MCFSTTRRRTPHYKWVTHLLVRSLWFKFPVQARTHARTYGSRVVVIKKLLLNIDRNSSRFPVYAFLLSCLNKIKLFCICLFYFLNTSEPVQTVDDFDYPKFHSHWNRRRWHGSLPRMGCGIGKKNIWWSAGIMKATHLCVVYPKWAV